MAEVAVLPQPVVDFSEYIRIIGRGKRAGQYLTQSQAQAAMQCILADQVQPEQLGAFLMLLRVREESAEELAGFTQACREYNSMGFKHIQADLDIGCYAGKRRHLPWFLLAVMVLAQQGYTVFMHGAPEPGSQRLFLDQVWKTFGWQVAHSAVEAEEQLARYGFCYSHLQSINSGLYRLLNLRPLFGLRSCANTLARMLNPTGAGKSLHGVFHRHFDQRHVDVARLLGDNGVYCFRGEGGEVEANPERELQLFQSQAAPVVFPAQLDKPRIKPKVLAPAMLKAFWLGTVDDEYGESAVVSTLAVMLTTLMDLPVAEALTTARQLWQHRHKAWPQ